MIGSAIKHVLHTHTHTHTYTYSLTHTHTCMYTHTLTHSLTHTHACTHTHSLFFPHLTGFITPHKSTERSTRICSCNNIIAFTQVSHILWLKARASLQHASCVCACVYALSSKTFLTFVNFFAYEVLGFQFQ